ncbi:hypothetical protein C8R45DRAFT_928700 [Mycena sanguinolenta]|nr:hypothetical protein C8R45DRAFT_928700 [Mycena sanguinolenta]
MSSTPAPPNAAEPPSRSAHAAAQARYRLKNAETEKEKARDRMRRLCAQRKSKKRPESPERNVPGEIYDEFVARSRAELFSSQEYKEFREYCDKVMVDRIHCINFEQAQEFEDFISRNPCVEDLGPNSDWYVEHLWHRRESRFPEWKEELADFHDIIAEHTPEELDRMQLEARSKQRDRYIIRARGGF